MERLLSLLHWALAYIKARYLVIPIPSGTKVPTITKWPDLRVNEDNANDYFGGSEPKNIGILTGVGANIIADVDCDCPEAIGAAEVLLPYTEATFGHASAPSSHRFYRVEESFATKRYLDLKGKTIIELRGSGSQTIAPPSLHPSGEPIEWKDAEQLLDHVPQPARVSIVTIQWIVAVIAAAILLARYWPKAGEGRHDAMLALAGLLVRANWSKDEALAFCDALYRAIDSPDLTKFDRVKSEVESTFEKWAHGENITGLTRLREYIDAQVLGKALEWLGISGIAGMPAAASVSDVRPIVDLLDRTLDEKVYQCVAALRAANSPPNLFFRRGTLAILSPAGAGLYSLRDVEAADLSWLLAKTVIFMKGKKKTDPDQTTVRGILTSITPSPEIPPIEGIVCAPVMRSDGTILDTPGYDPASMLFYAPGKGLVVPAIPETPTAEEVKSALEAILEVLVDFPFTDQSSLANAIAAILTPIVRPAINGPTPMAIFDATAPGTGKTLLAEVVSILATGTDGAMTTVPRNKDEMQKKLTSLLRENPTMIIFDNVSNRLDTDHLMAVISAETWIDRLLGASQQISLSVRCAWIVTSNNIQLDTQMSRRSYWVRMDAKTPRPHLRSGFKHAHLKSYVKENRGRLLAAILTLARAWFASGKPLPDVNPLGGFESWTTVLGGIEQNAGIKGFIANTDELYERADDETQLWLSLLAQLWELYGEEPFTTSDLTEKMRDTLNGDLKELIELIFGEAATHEVTLKQHIPKEFKKRIEKRFGTDDTQYWLAAATKAHHLARWVVRSNQDPTDRKAPRFGPSKAPSSKKPPKKTVGSDD